MLKIKQYVFKQMHVLLNVNMHFVLLNCKGF